MGQKCCSDIHIQAPESNRAQQIHGTALPDLGEVPAAGAELVPASGDAVASVAQPAQAQPAVPSQQAEGVAGPPSGGEETFVSKVGELPKFSKEAGPAAAADDETGSQASSLPSDNLTSVADAAAVKQQKQQAKSLVKDFVKRMVKGQELSVMVVSGQLKTCTVSLTRKLDTLRIRTGKNKRDIALTDIDEISVGVEVPEGVMTPVDELCATLMLSTEDCITFRLPDVNERDTFVMCLLMFCNGGGE